MLARAFEDVDIGRDEIPDGADDGFGAPEFGDDFLPETRVAARVGVCVCVLLSDFSYLKCLLNNTTRPSEHTHKYRCKKWRGSVFGTS